MQSLERWIKLRDASDRSSHAEILIKLSDVQSVISTYQNNRFEFAELCLPNNKYYIDRETVGEIKKLIEEASPVKEFPVGKYRTVNA